MNFEQYITDATATAIYPGRGTILGINYCALKMAGEAGELLDHLMKRSERDLILKEVGDVLWYIAATADEMALPITPPMEPQSAMLTPLELGALVCVGVSRYTETLGKAMRDDGFGMPADYNTGALRAGEKGNGRPPSAWAALTPERVQKICGALNDTLTMLALVCNAYNSSLQEAADMNIAKLASRHKRGKLGGDGDNR